MQCSNLPGLQILDRDKDKFALLYDYDQQLNYKGSKSIKYLLTWLGYAQVPLEDGGGSA